jgi:spore coat protein U-like protein
MKILVRFLLAIAALLAALPASATLSCSITVSNVNVVYNYFPTVTGQGTLGIACTRDPTRDNRKPTVWIGMVQTTTGNTATLDTGGSTLTYEIFHASTTSGVWTNTGNGVNNTSTTNGAVRQRLDFGSNTSSSLTASIPFYYSIQSLQFKPAGVYVDTVAITMRLDSATGALITTSTLDVHISIPRSCRFSTPPSAISINYPAFSATPVTATSDFAITCTLTTTYTIALDQPRSVVPTVNLAYGLSLVTTAATGTAIAQPYTVNISVDAGQAGRCSTATCTGTDTRTLTVTY